MSAFKSVFRKLNSDENGAVTVEFAIGLPAIILFLTICISVSLFGIKEVQCANASGTIARAIAMGKSNDEAISVGKKIVGNNADIDISENDEIIAVSVKVKLPIVHISDKFIESKSYAYKEPM